MIRDLLDRLERAKDRIVEYWEKSSGDPAARKIFLSDSKEAFYQAVAAYQLLDSEHVSASRGYLEGAKSSALQSASSVDEGELRTEFLAAFDACYAAIDAELDRLAPPPGPTDWVDPARHPSEKSCILSCSVCNDPAAKWEIGHSKYRKSTALIYSGITMSMHHDLEHAEAVFLWLLEESFGKVHRYSIEKLKMSEGMDAYCPTCDKIYCRRHYNAGEVYDEGFYDCTYGTCPHGHRRMIDD